MSRRSEAVLRSLLLPLGLAVVLSSAMAVRADDATPAPPLAQARSCAERYPAEGPAGLDLQLGCVAAEIVASYTGAAGPDEPGRISAWLLPLGLFTGGLIAFGLVIRGLNSGLNRRLAPAAPATWWSCPRCRSLNEDHARVCYACGQAWTPAALILASPTSPPSAAGGPPTRESAAGTVIPSSDPPGPPRGSASG